jgi:ribosomal protein S27AE
MTNEGERPQAEAADWECGRCGIPLEIGTVKVAYLDTEQPVDLARCPRCGSVMVPEELALGRMVQVEQLLEDK